MPSPHNWLATLADQPLGYPWISHGYPLDTSPFSSFDIASHTAGGPRSHGRHKLGGQVLDLSHLLQQDQLGHNGHTLQPNRGGPEYLHMQRCQIFAAGCGLESLKRLEVLLQVKAQLCLMHDFSHVGSFVKQSQMFECLLTRSVCDEATGYYAFVGTKLGAQFIISGQCNELNVDPHHWMAPQL